MKTFNQAFSHVPEISVGDLAGEHDYRVIDVREPHEYHGGLGHIPGAELVPLQSLPSAAAEWDRGERLAIVCHSGARSMRAAQYLMGEGFGHVVNVAGGTMAWAALTRGSALA